MRCEGACQPASGRACRNGVRRRATRGRDVRWGAGREEERARDRQHGGRQSADDRGITVGAGLVRPHAGLVEQGARPRSSRAPRAQCKSRQRSRCRSSSDARRSSRRRPAAPEGASHLNSDRTKPMMTLGLLPLSPAMTSVAALARSEMRGPVLEAGEVDPDRSEDPALAGAASGDDPCLLDGFDRDLREAGALSEDLALLLGHLQIEGRREEDLPRRPARTGEVWTEQLSDAPSRQ